MESPAARHAEATSGLWLTPPSASPAEDRYGNCFEEMPKAVVSGQWQWPLTPLAGASEPKDGRGLEASRQSHQAQVQHRLWEANPNPNPNPNPIPIPIPNPTLNPNPDPNLILTLILTLTLTRCSTGCGRLTLTLTYL